MDGILMNENSSSEKTPVLSVKNLYKSFGNKTVLKGVSFDVYKGEIFGLLGPNGSGKTTTIKLALGLLGIDRGSVEICGYDISKNFEKAIRNVGAIIENPELYKYLSGRENLMQCYRMYDDIKPETVEWAIESVGLKNRIDEKVSRYSLGMRQRLGIAQAIIHSPRILVLDEPTNGLDPEGIKQFREFLVYLAHEKGVSVLISSHLLAELDAFCDRVAVINSGKVIGIKTIEEIRNGEVDGDKQGYNYKISVDNCQTAEAFFKEKEIPYRLTFEGAFEISIGDNKDEIIFELVKRDVHFNSFAPIERTLEDAFIEMVNESGGSKI